MGYHSTRLERQREASHSSVRSPLGAPCSLSAAVAGLNIGGLGPVLPAFHDSLREPLCNLCVLFGANFSGSLTATVVTGPLLDRNQLRTFLLTSLGQVLLSLATSLPTVIIAAALTGAGGGANSLGSAVLASRQLGVHARRVLSLMHMTFGPRALVPEI